MYLKFDTLEPGKTYIYIFPCQKYEWLVKTSLEKTKIVQGNSEAGICYFPESPDAEPYFLNKPNFGDGIRLANFRLATKRETEWIEDCIEKKLIDNTNVKMPEKPKETIINNYPIY